MRRTVTMAGLVGLAAVPAPAQAAAAVDRGACRGGSGDPHLTGVARLGRGGVVAADVTRSMPLGECHLQRLREDVDPYGDDVIDVFRP
ncbi:hypothetical protein [Nonomuraea sp. NPDC005501]|uniref:hypothetical protein n=1 Tax=Nonomuraea sp. NPDC005501 TaxID=3156884 RepID=UPI0033B5C357